MSYRGTDSPIEYIVQAPPSNWRTLLFYLFFNSIKSSLIYNYLENAFSFPTAKNRSPLAGHFFIFF